MNWQSGCCCRTGWYGEAESNAGKKKKKGDEKILDYYRDVNILCKDDTGIIAHFSFFLYL